MSQTITTAAIEAAARDMLYEKGARSWADVDEGEYADALALARSSAEAAKRLIPLEKWPAVTVVQGELVNEIEVAEPPRV